MTGFKGLTLNQTDGLLVFVVEKKCKFVLMFNIYLEHDVLELFPISAQIDGNMRSEFAFFYANRRIKKMGV